MTSEEELHTILASFAPAVIVLLRKSGFFRTGKLTKSFWKAFQASSISKNSKAWLQVWDLFSIPSLEEAQKTIASDLGISELEKINVANPWVKSFFRQRQKQFVALTTRTDIKRFRPLAENEAKKIFAEIAKNPGEHEKRFAKALEDSYLADGNQTRLKMIKRTEAQHATNGGGRLFAKSSDAKFKRRITAGDRRVRPAHSRDAGYGKIPIDEPYPSTGEMFAGEKSINCRCSDQYSFD